MILIISSSLNPQSRSLLLARNVLLQLQGIDVECELVDLAEENLPRCNAGSCYGEPAVVSIAEKNQVGIGSDSCDAGLQLQHLLRSKKLSRTHWSGVGKKRLRGFCVRREAKAVIWQ